MTAEDSSSPPIALYSFACANCNHEAGLIKFYQTESAGKIIRESFTSRITYRVEAEDCESIRDIVLAGDIQALYEFNLEVTSFYCPHCRACYCGEHWVHWDVFDDEEGFFWHDSIHGRCPLGHERMLED